MDSVGTELVGVWSKSDTATISVGFSVSFSCFFVFDDIKVLLIESLVSSLRRSDLDCHISGWILI